MLLLTVFSALFLLLLIALAFASFKLLGARDDKGQTTAPGCLNGCMTAVALALIGTLGLGAFVVGAWSLAASEGVSELIRASPDMKVGVWLDRSEKAQSKPGYPLRVVLEWKGHSEPTTSLLRRLEEAGAGGEISVEVTYETNEDGEEITIVDLALPMSQYDAQELADVLDELSPDLKLTEGLELTFTKVERVDVR